jgi:iron(II)-dependent oxidoreductase
MVLLTAARMRLLALVEDFSDEQMRVPKLTILNPPLWEIGHVAWFQEKWNLRHQAGRPSLRADADAHFDSSAVAHDTRWDLPLPSRSEVLAYLDGVLIKSLERLIDPARPPSNADLYFAQLALLHEEMHVEALAYTRQTLALPPPRHGKNEPTTAEEKRAFGIGAGPLPGDVEVPGGSIHLGAEPTPTFVFDNEKWAHPVTLKPFRIARAATSNAEYAEFVEAGGYRRREFWSDGGWNWRESERADHPIYWKREPGGKWLRRWFHRWIPLEEHLPVLHVNWFEAEAFCCWRGRRLPTEAEWELAASGARDEPGGRGALATQRRLFPWGSDAPTPTTRARLGAWFSDVVDVAAFPDGESAFGCRQMVGNVWEWTASDFQPYPGFTPDPYADYSQPWFGNHKILRGGCFVTQFHLIRNTWRNFYLPDRRDVWAGFRTCAR